MSHPNPPIDLIVLNLLEGYHHHSHAITWHFANGAQATLINGIYHHFQYDNGDQLWFNWHNGKYTVAKILTHDGQEFNYEPEHNHVGGQVGL